MVEQKKATVTISVIIPTYNGAHKIEGVLLSLERQTWQPDEVIVVIDGSTDGTRDYIRGRSYNLSRFKIIEQENGGRANVRNRGAREASGELLIFFDDDMHVDERCIEIHAKHHQTHQQSLVSGTATDDLSKQKGDFLRFKEQISRTWESELKNKEDRSLKEDEVFLTAANFSIPKMIFTSLGGFNSVLNDGEDFDLAFRALKNGFYVFYNSKAKATHMDETSCRQFIKRGRSYYKAGIQLAQQNPNLYYERFKSRLATSKSGKHFFYRFFCNKWWVKSIDADQWVWLPKAFRYKLYDVVVTANISFYPDTVKF